MKREEIDKLIGGYATGNLTAHEKQALAESALNDQEVFNAVEAEQPLKDLLDDAGARAQIRRALESRKTMSWYRRPWVWGTATASTVCAIALIAVLHRSGHPAEQTMTVVTEARPPASEPLAPRAQSISTEQPRAIASPLPPKVKHNSIAEKKAADLSEPLPLAVPALAPRLTSNSFAQSSATVTSTAVTVPYVIERAGGPAPAGTLFDPGEQIRLSVQVPSSGQLSVLRLDASGNWTTLANVPVETNHTYIVPKEGITIDGDQHLRLRLEPTSQPAAPITVDVVLRSK